MIKKGVITLVLSILLSTSYVVAAEQYQYKVQQQSQQSYQRQNQLEFLKEKIQLEQFELIEVGVELSGIVYDEKLQPVDIENKIEQMRSILESATMHSKIYKMGDASSLKKATYQNAIQEATIERKGEDWQYIFSLKNQKDIHENTYYNLKIVGQADVRMIDQLRNKGYEQLQAWHVTPKETIYFKGMIPGALSSAESTKVKEELFDRLEAKQTNVYQDDLNETTYVYYGYTPYIQEYIVEADGQKSNVQVGFKYDELQDRTELIIAFPFYNQPF